MCNEARCLCDNLARSKAPVTDDAVLDREEKMPLTLKRDLLPPKKGANAENRVRYALDRKKNILTI